ncbi:MAG: sigma-54 interaction domain-containing protein [Nitrospinales bacterium]
MKNSKKPDWPETEDLSAKQAIQYARELSGLYRSEKDKRLQLETANKELKRLNAELHKLRGQLEMENAYLREEMCHELSFGNIIGKSPAFQKVLNEIELVARTDSSVLLEGETGTGKELIARAIHEQSQRNKRPLVKVNCGAIPRDLFESEFFGHLKGAFTGAIKDRVGRFQLAHKGTLFLDEVSEIPLELQTNLLRVLQEGQFEPVGDDHTRQVDVRIISATNRNLSEEVNRGRFRNDLYYRLNVIPIYIPPLRERPEDIETLATHFLAESCRRLNVKQVKLTKKNVDELQAYDWPGNVREMQNVIERAVIISKRGPLKFDLTSHIGIPTEPKSLKNNNQILSEEERKRLERSNILAALEETNWKIYGPGGAAEMLGAEPATLAYRMKKMGLKKPR